MQPIPQKGGNERATGRFISRRKVARETHRRTRRTARRRDSTSPLRMRRWRWWCDNSRQIARFHQHHYTGTTRAAGLPCARSAERQGGQRQIVVHHRAQLHLPGCCLWTTVQSGDLPQPERPVGRRTAQPRRLAPGGRPWSGQAGPPAHGHLPEGRRTTGSEQRGGNLAGLGRSRCSGEVAHTRRQGEVLPGRQARSRMDPGHLAPEPRRARRRLLEKGAAARFACVRTGQWP